MKKLNLLFPILFALCIISCNDDCDIICNQGEVLTNDCECLSVDPCSDVTCATGEILTADCDCVDSAANINIWAFLDKNSTWRCEALFESKLDIYKQVAYDILKLNKLAIRQDDRKDYVIQEREKYSWILQTMLGILGYMERIVNGWVTKTKNPHTG